MRYGVPLATRGRMLLVAGDVDDSQTVPIALELVNDATAWEERPDLELPGRLAGVVYDEDEDHAVASKFARKTLWFRRSVVVLAGDLRFQRQHLACRNL